MKLTMAFNHWAAAMFPAFCGSFADGGLVAAANGRHGSTEPEEKKMPSGEARTAFKSILILQLMAGALEFA
jgi:hypothetical protein